LKQEKAARKVIMDAYAAQQARIAAQLRAGPESLSWKAEPRLLAADVLPLFEQTATIAAKQAIGQLPIRVEWGQVNKPVLALARARATAFGDAATATAEERTASRVASWVARGGTLPELIESVAEVWSGPRADVAAATEVTSLYHQGSVTAWQESNVVKGWQFHSVHDSAVCEICDPLDGQEFDLDDDDHAPPQHPGCRCFSSAVVKET